ncbi:MAG: hypothetical protein R2820_08800 [Cyclobacteriaceae bacterium]|nr:hypothetical protein [Cyclobacteriaceae bacterium]
MEFRDFIVTPIIVGLIYVGAYLIRPLASDSQIRRYFLPGLTVKIVGAILVGFIYQFYYSGGDTFNFHTFGSRIIWNAFVDSPEKGFRLLFSNGVHSGDLFEYSSQILFYRDWSSFLIVRLATLFDLFTFSTYTATAAMFAMLSFAGMWMFYLTFYRMFPTLHYPLAIACLFIPSVAFWGSGIFKDTVTLAALGFITYSFDALFLRDKPAFQYVVLLIVGFIVIYAIKKYVLLSFLPALFIWFFSRKVTYVKSTIAKALLLPIVVSLVISLGYFAILKVGEDDPRYNISRLAQTVKITAYDIRYGWGARMGEGSGYTLGELDGSWQSMIRLAPQAINVSLFRPYFWEVSNPLMLLSAIESAIMLVISAIILVRVRHNIFRYMIKPEVLFCLAFSMIFAFAVGVSSYNFGTLSRYKIPLMPFYAVALVLLWKGGKSEKKVYGE